MTIAFWCVLVAAALPFAYTLMAKASRKFDNARPREYLETTSGWRKRAHWTQLNSFEAFPPFAAAIIINYLVKGPTPLANELALGFVAFRVLYGFCYLTDQALLRSVMWFAANACVVGLFVHAA